jgi:26S proteasome regulatory subunit N6
MFLAKLFREILEALTPFPKEVPEHYENLAKFILQWSISSNISFLQSKAELKVAEILGKRNQLKDAIRYVESVIKEARIIDDKHLLVEAHLLETKLQFTMENLPKAKSALTACRANSNSVFCSTLLIAEIETTAGMIHIFENDYKIAYSYFYEAFEMFHQNKKSNRALENFQYIVLTKIMSNLDDEADNLFKGRFGLIYGEQGFSPIMFKILSANKNKSLVELEAILKDHGTEINANPTISSQINLLYENLLEKNILKLTKPYTKVQLSYLSLKVGVNVNRVEKKISEMILDEKLKGTLDQGIGNLILFRDDELDPMYKNSLQILENMESVLGALFEKSKKLRAK